MWRAGSVFRQRLVIAYCPARMNFAVNYLPDTHDKRGGIKVLRPPEVPLVKSSHRMSQKLGRSSLHSGVELVLETPTPAGLKMARSPPVSPFPFHVETN